MTGPARAPSRMATLLGMTVFALLLVGVVQGVNLMRHPMPDGLPPVPELDAPEADPRFEVECDEPVPGEFVTSNDLLDCPHDYHEVEVRYRGEVVGGVLARDGGAWVQLNDDIYADARGPLPAHRDYAGGNAGVGVFIPPELAQRVEIVGGPRFRGDVLEVVGEFRRVDPEHRESAVIIASKGEVFAAGRPIEDPILPERRLVAIVLVLLAAAVAVGERVIAWRW